jgi:hypothetical protein
MSSSVSLAELTFRTVEETLRVDKNTLSLILKNQWRCFWDLLGLRREIPPALLENLLQELKDQANLQELDGANQTSPMGCLRWESVESLQVSTDL